MERSNFIYRATRFWWIPLLTGLVFIGFGIWCLCNPVASMTLLAYIFAGALGAVGLFNLLYGFGNSNNNHGWGWAVGCGIIEILCSIWLFFLPAPVLAQAFVFCIGLYLIFVAISALSESFVMSRFSSFWSIWFFLLLVVCIICACVFLAAPIMGAMAVWIYIGISFITYGLYRVLLSIKLNKINNSFRN